jgi:transcriptional regulator with XRE-family HTH domain
VAIPFGSELRRRRLAAGLSLADLARAANYSKSHLSRVETGAKAAGQDLARRCDAALHADGMLLALIPVEPSRDHGPADMHDGWDSPWLIRLDPDGQGEFDTVPRRGVLVAGALSMLGWTAARDFGRRRGGDREYDSFRTMFDLVRGMGQFMAPAMLMPVLIAHTHALRLLAAAARPASRDPLWLLAGRYAEFTGWIAQESGNDAHALLWTNHAVEFAAAGGDRRLGAYALVRRAEIAMYQTRPRETVALAQHAQAQDCGSRIRGLAAQREAQGHALAGDARRCEQALDRAARWLTEPDHEGPLPLLGTSNVGDLTAMVAGWCLFDLGKPRKAGELLRAQLDQTPSTAYRMKARISARYALALVGDGEVEQGCAEVPQLLDWYSSADSATVRADLHRLLHALNRWPSAPHVRRVVPELTAALSPR